MASCKKDDNKPGTVKGPSTDSLQRILNKYTAAGVPGAIITLKNSKGYWTGTAGFSSLENQTPMSDQVLLYGFSITKMVTAISVMQMKENGLIDLDRPIRDYLPASLHDVVPNTSTVTVKMLLNQTSGYNDYVRTDAFAAIFRSDPMKVWTRNEYYDFFRQNISNSFPPGSDFQYSNTNYYLLSVIIDHITGRPHSEWFQQKIFNRLSLTKTYYKDSPGYPLYNQLPEAYWPSLADGQTENISDPQRAWMMSEEYGATGIIASPKDYIRLLEGLVNGELVSGTSFGQMKQWVTGSTSQEPDYGFGLCYWGYKGKTQFGHDGDGIGSTIELIYFPQSKTYLLAAANGTTEFGGNMAQQLFGFRNEVAEYLAGF